MTALCTRCGLPLGTVAFRVATVDGERHEVCPEPAIGARAVLLGAGPGPLVPAAAAPALYAACLYALQRVGTDPGFADVMLFTETHNRLCLAVAEAAGIDAEELLLESRKDRQPAHRRREPRRVVLEHRLEAIARRISEGGGCGLGGDHDASRAGEGCTLCDVLALAEGVG